MGVAIQSLNARFRLVVPHFDQSVVCTGDEVGSITPSVVIDGVDPPFVSLQGEIGNRGAQRPHLDGAIQRGGCKCVGVLWVEHHLHYVVAVPFKDLGARPPAIPIPQLDQHVVGAGEDDGEGGVHGNVANVVGVCLKLFDLVHGVVVVDAHQHVICAA